MNKKIYSIASLSLSLLLLSSLYAQEEWFWQNPLLQSNRLYSTYFIVTHNETGFIFANNKLVV